MDQQRCTLAQIAQHYGLRLSTVRTYHGQANAARRAGQAGEHLFPAAVDRIGNVPIFDTDQVRHWYESRPGRGVGGGRPPRRKQTGEHQ